MFGNDTARLGMPLLQPAQAQKHVTVNEALMRLDGLVNLVLQSLDHSQPPEFFVDGTCWAVASAGGGDWAGQGGKIAVAVNGGWVFSAPRSGMRAFIADRGLHAIHDGSDWIEGALSLGSAFGSALLTGIAEAEADIAPGETFQTSLSVPDGAMVIGAVARVTEAITGSLSSWRLGNADSTNRFGSGLGLGVGSWARGLLGSPMSFYQPAPLIMTAEGGEFAGGRVRLGLHYLQLHLPRG